MHPDDASVQQEVAQRVMEKVEGLQSILHQWGVEAHVDALVAWCDSMGVAFLSEVKENLDELVAAIGLTDTEGAALRKAFAGVAGEEESADDAQPRASAVVERGAQPLKQKAVPLARAKTVVHPEAPRMPMEKQSHSAIARTRTSPVTDLEVSVAAHRAAKAYVPLYSWPVHRRSTGTARAVQEKRVAAKSKQEPLTANELLVEATEDPRHERAHPWILRMQRRSRVDAWLLRQRIPPPQALENPFLGAIEEGAWRKGEWANKPTYESLRKSILSEHKQEIASGLNEVFRKGYSLTAARVAQEVQNRFIEGYMSCGSPELLPATHGSLAENYPSILKRGLLVPGCQSGIQVANGSAHGKGIYTAHVHAAWLSNRFCSERKMLLCGVINDAVDVLGQQKFIGGRPVTAASAAVKHVGDAMVIFDESRVVPLYMAEEKEEDPGSPEQSSRGQSHGRKLAPLPTANTGAKAKLAAQKIVRIGTRQVLHRPSGQRAFEPALAERGRWEVLQKRRYERCLRDVARAVARGAKPRRDAPAFPGEAER